jgi:capsular exopolysaccharide synthesis family protein
MDLHEYLRLVRRRWKLLAACVLVAGAAAFITTPAEPEGDQIRYRATHQLLRDSSAATPQSLATVSLFVRTGEVPVRVAERIGFTRNPALLASTVKLDPDEQVGTLDITVTGSSREQAAERANLFAEETLAYLGEQATSTQQDAVARVNEQLTTLQIDIDALDEEIADAQAEGEVAARQQAERDSKLRQYGAALDQQQQVLNQPPPSAGYVTLQPALPELARVDGGGFAAPTSRPARTAIAVLVGFALGLAVVLLAERLDTRIHDVTDAAGAFGLPVIAEVPDLETGKQPTVVSTLDPLSAAAEAYRSVRASLLLTPTTVLGTGPARPAPATPEVVLITSAAPGDGKTTTAANLAATMAESGRSVLILGCDFRRPEIHRYFGVAAAPGIADVLTGSATRRLEEIARPTTTPGVWVAPSGEGLRNLGDLAAGGRDLVAEARALADVVIIDTAPLLATNDAAELIPSCDSVVLVARIGKTTVDGAHRTRDLLERLGASVAGVVAIGVPAANNTYAKYYTSTATPEPRSSTVPTLRRTIRSDKLTDRIGPWRGSSSVPTTGGSGLAELDEAGRLDPWDQPESTGTAQESLTPGGGSSPPIPDERLGRHLATEPLSDPATLPTDRQPGPGAPTPRPVLRAAPPSGDADGKGPGS